VQSKDAVGNYSGNNAYTIDFVVVNQSTITHFYPYPNPCTTNMRFVFTLTGSKPPDELLIRISTMTGRIVREVQKTEFGAIHIGNNISEWAWDGTDQYGDRLANGVYLYQVFTKLDGDEVMHRTSDAEKKNSRLIINNTGKIYLMH
jgi:flagellar hook assembly protein FlgD